MTRRFPAPWSVRELEQAFVVSDANGQALAFCQGTRRTMRCLITAWLQVRVLPGPPRTRRPLEISCRIGGGGLRTPGAHPRRFGIGRIETSGSVAMRGYSHLSDDEREQIGLLKVLGHSIGAIARAIRRPKSTVSRELSRKRLPSGRYSPLHAAGAYQLRRRREALIEKDRALRSFVLDRLAEGWTPELRRWLKAGNERRLRAVGCETIYAFIYRAATDYAGPSIPPILRTRGTGSHAPA